MHKLKMESIYLLQTHFCFFNLLPLNGKVSKQYIYRKLFVKVFGKNICIHPRDIYLHTHSKVVLCTIVTKKIP